MTVKGARSDNLRRVPRKKVATVLAKADQVVKESQDLAAASAEKMVQTRAGDKPLPAHGQLKDPKVRQHR